MISGATNGQTGIVPVSSHNLSMPSACTTVNIYLGVVRRQEWPNSCILHIELYIAAVIVVGYWILQQGFDGQLPLKR